MNISEGYGAYCHECGDISIMPSDANTHIGLARKHHESTGHTCEVYGETQSGFLNGKNPEIVSQDYRVIAVFDKYLNQPG